MASPTTARSMSRFVRQQLNNRAGSGQVLAVFERACTLATPAGELIALVTPPLGNGPLNIVVDRPAWFLAGVEAGAPVSFSEQRLRLGELRVELSGAPVWEPRPDWGKLRRRLPAIEARLPRLRTLSLCCAPADTFLALLESTRCETGLAAAVLTTARQAGEALPAGWRGDEGQLQAAVHALAGLGSGLTPAGDDFLAGVMLWAWLAHPAPDSFCRTVRDAAAPRTTTLAAAFLRAAARGECSAAWHTLLAALNAGAEADLTAAVRPVLAQGASSGADTLAGFLYLTG